MKQQLLIYANVLANAGKRKIDCKLVNLFSICCTKWIFRCTVARHFPHLFVSLFVEIFGAGHIRLRWRDGYQRKPETKQYAKSIRNKTFGKRRLVETAPTKPKRTKLNRNSVERISFPISDTKIILGVKLARHAVFSFSFQLLCIRSTLSS